MAIRAFEKASLASLRNMASFMNIITTLDVLKQHRIQIICLQQMMLVCYLLCLTLFNLYLGNLSVCALLLLKQYILRVIHLSSGS